MKLFIECSPFNFCVGLALVNSTLFLTMWAWPLGLAEDCVSVSALFCDWLSVDMLCECSGRHEVDNLFVKLVHMAWIMTWHFGVCKTLVRVLCLKLSAVVVLV